MLMHPKHLEGDNHIDDEGRITINNDETKLFERVENFNTSAPLYRRKRGNTPKPHKKYAQKMFGKKKMLI